ncbi:hypothetical protein ACU4GI_45955 [Cupriavidus basilensis]
MPTLLAGMAAQLVGHQAMSAGVAQAVTRALVGKAVQSGVQASMGPAVAVAAAVVVVVPVAGLDPMGSVPPVLEAHLDSQARVEAAEQTGQAELVARTGAAKLLPFQARQLEAAASASSGGLAAPSPTAQRKYKDSICNA